MAFETIYICEGFFLKKIFVWSGKTRKYTFCFYKFQQLQGFEGLKIRKIHYLVCCLAFSEKGQIAGEMRLT